jgi:hypothetical protein
MSIFVHESQKCLFHRRKNFPSIASEFGTEVLGATEDARGADEFDTRVDLGHVGGIGPQGIVGELSVDLRSARCL